MCPISPTATASIVIRTTVWESDLRTRALAYKGSFTGPASIAVMSTLATPAIRGAEKAVSEVAARIRTTAINTNPVCCKSRPVGCWRLIESTEYPVMVNFVIEPLLSKSDRRISVVRSIPSSCLFKQKTGTSPLRRWGSGCHRNRACNRRNRAF